MRAIIDYILNMVPYMIITIPVYLIARLIVLKISRKKTNWYHEASLFIFVLFIAGLASQTIIPKLEFGVSGNISIVKNGVHGTNFIPLKVLVETYKEVFINGNINYFLINFLGNIIIFMPIGFFVPLLWKATNKKVVLIGLCSSVFIEFCQLFLSRGTDVDDLILNTAGAFLGLLVYRVLYKKFREYMLRFRLQA